MSANDALSLRDLGILFDNSSRRRSSSGIYVIPNCPPRTVPTDADSCPQVLVLPSLPAGRNGNERRSRTKEIRIK